jgi:uncharacterized lipoprotein YajG
MRPSGLVKVVLLILAAFTLFAGCETPSPGGYPVPGRPGG